MPFASSNPRSETDAEKYERQRYERLRWWSGLTFGDLLDRAADVYPHKEALVDDAGVCAPLFACGKLVLGNATDPPGICRLIEKERVNTVIWVPALTLRMLCAEETDGYDLSSLALIYCGGGASTPEMIRGAMVKFGCAYLCSYGGTEGMLVTTRREDDVDTLCCSIGKPTCPYDHYKVVDDADEALPQGHTGHLVVKGPSIFSGYVDMAEENANAFTKDGYFRTGDLAAIDEEGYIQLTGRGKDTIKRGGESIFAAEIENLICDHPQVDAVAVIDIPDPEMGERVCAVIQPQPGADLSLDDVSDYLKSRGASVLQLPEHLRIVAAIPLTPAGKLDKKRLKAGILPTFDTCISAQAKMKETPC
jgi:non-ribosomal peptide synthetase component E (peptide arylation enzyme)